MTDIAATEGLDPSQSRLSPWPGWCAVALLAFVVFAFTATRGAQWQDPGWHTWRILTADLHHPLGLALVHPLHHWLGRGAVALGIFEPCFSVTLVSALFGAVAAANVYGCVLSVTQRRSAAWFAALSIAVAHTSWQMATRAEVYTVTTALLAGECWCLAEFARTNRPKFLNLLFLLNGLGVANHMLAVLTLPALVVDVIVCLRARSVRLSHVVVSAGCWLVGSLPYTWLIAAEAMHTGDVSAAIASALFGHGFSDEVLNFRLSGRTIFYGLGVFCLNFPSLLLPFALVGAVRAKSMGVPVLFGRALAGMAAVQLWFGVRYTVVDQHTFFLPLYVVLCILGGIGFSVMLLRPRTGSRRAIIAVAAVTLAATPLVYAALPSVARRFDVLESVQRNKPYRDDYDYVFAPWSVIDDSADRMSREAVELAGDGGLILLGDPMAEFAVRYSIRQARADGVEATLDVSGALVQAAVASDRTVVLVPRNVDDPRTAAPAGRWRRVGDLFVLEPSAEKN